MGGSREGWVAGGRAKGVPRGDARRVCTKAAIAGKRPRGRRGIAGGRAKGVHKSGNCRKRPRGRRGIAGGRAKGGCKSGNCRKRPRGRRGIAGGRAKGGCKSGNCRKKAQGTREGWAQKRQLPEKGPGSFSPLVKKVNLRMLQPQGFYDHYQTYFRFSTPISHRNIPFSGRGYFSAISHTPAR